MLGLRAKRPVRVQEVVDEDGRYDADELIDGADLRCTVGHVSGGIRIRSETIDMDEWITRLLQALKAEAAHSDAARQALENIVIGGHQ